MTNTGSREKEKKKKGGGYERNYLLPKNENAFPFLLCCHSNVSLSTQKASG